VEYQQLSFGANVAMVLDKKIQEAAAHFGVTSPEDWQQVPVAWLRQVPNVGPVTIDHLRIYLAARGLTLKDDATPDYWQKNLSAARIGTTIATTDTAVALPFTILIDSREQHPFAFVGHLADADQQHRPLLVPVEHTHLGDSHGDYAIKGIDDCFIERKSLDDAQGTFLAHGDRRDAWLATLEFLAGCKTAAVVIEATYKRVCFDITARGSRDKRTLAVTLHRQVIAWQNDYRVPFIFCDDRRFAEATVLQILRRHYRHHTQRTSAADKQQSQWSSTEASSITAAF
jgi:DNA excision repair protein ERCC-4